MASERRRLNHLRRRLRTLWMDGYKLGVFELSFSFQDKFRMLTTLTVKPPSYKKTVMELDGLTLPRADMVQDYNGDFGRSDYQELCMWTIRQCCMPKD